MLLKMRNVILFLISLLTLSSCSKKNNEVKKPEEPETKDYPVPTSKTTLKIIKTDEWSEFKTFWLELSSIDTSGYDNLDFDIDYDLNEVEDFSNKLKNIIVKLKSISDESNYIRVIDFIYSICTERIDYICFGKRSMLTRMIPLATTTEKEIVIDSLEKQIDILLSLKDKKVLDEPKFNMALKNVNLNIQNYSIINAIAQNYDGRVVFTLNQFEALDKVDKAKGLIDLQISNFENHYTDFQKKLSNELNEEEKIYYAELEKKYVETKEEIEKLKSIFPIMTELLIDLEK